MNQPDTSTTFSLADAQPSTRHRRLSRRKKVVLSGLAFLIFFVGLEIVFAACGVRPFREAIDPFLDFEPGIPLFVREGSEFVTNPPKRTYFNVQSFPQKKQSDSIRIFCLGGSTTYGRPYKDRFSYVSGLRSLLQRLAPDKDWQVVNCGGISYSSFRLAALMEELSQYQPDLVVFCEGHNEFLEERTYRDLRERSQFVTAGLRTASHFRTTTVVHQLLKPWLPKVAGARMKAEVNTILDHTVGPETYHRDPKLRRSVLSHFRASLERVCALSQRAGAQTILIQPACNLRDFSPFKSEPSSSAKTVWMFEQHLRIGRDALQRNDVETAIHEFRNAIALDPLHADAQFLAGQAAFKFGDYPAAKKFFVTAKDEDVCPLRALSEIAPIVEEVGQSNRVAVIPFPEYVAERCHRRLGHEIPGSESFVDHVHPHPDLHLELAMLLVRQMASLKFLQIDPPNVVDQAFQDEWEEWQLALTPELKAEAFCSLAQELTWAGKIQEALPISREAAELHPQNAWVLCQYGRLLERTQDEDGALEIYQRAVSINPNEALALQRLGDALLRRGQLPEARNFLRKAVTHPADHAAPLAFRVGIRVSYGDCLLQMGDLVAAREQYNDAHRLAPDSALVRDRLSRISKIPRVQRTGEPRSPL